MHHDHLEAEVSVLQWHSGVMMTTETIDLWKTHVSDEHED